MFVYYCTLFHTIDLVSMSTLISFSWACCASGAFSHESRHFTACTAFRVHMLCLHHGPLCAIQSNSSPLSKSPLLLLPLPIPVILLLQHDAVHTRLEQRKRQARLPLQLAQSVPNLERRTRCQLVQFACQLFNYISRAYCYSVAFLTCAFYWVSLSLRTKRSPRQRVSAHVYIRVCA